MSNLRTTVTRIRIHRDGESPVYGEAGINIELDDEGGGAYLRLSQEDTRIEEGYASIAITGDELKMVYREGMKMLEAANDADARAWK